MAMSLGARASSDKTAASTARYQTDENIKMSQRQLDAQTNAEKQRLDLDAQSLARKQTAAKDLIAAKAAREGMLRGRTIDEQMAEQEGMLYPTSEEEKRARQQAMVA